MISRRGFFGALLAAPLAGAAPGVVVNKSPTKFRDFEHRSYSVVFKVSKIALEDDRLHRAVRGAFLRQREREERFLRQMLLAKA